MNSLVLILSVTAAYLFFYSAYDKSRSSISFPLLLDVLLVRRGHDWTLVELNKVLSLVGMSILLMSFLPYFAKEKATLLFSAIVMLVTHSVYSSYKFYGWNPNRIMNEKALKRTALMMGSAAEIVIILGMLGNISVILMVILATALSVMHFIGMELDYNRRLMIRPFGYLPFVLAAVVAVQVILKLA